MSSVISRKEKLSIIPKEHTSTYALLVAIHRKELEEIGVVNDNDGEALRINKHDWMHYADSIKGSGINATRLSKKSLFVNPIINFLSIRDSTLIFNKKDHI